MARFLASPVYICVGFTLDCYPLPLISLTYVCIHPFAATRIGFNKACMRGTSLMSSMSKGMASQASVMPKAVYSGESAGNDGYRIVGSTVVMRLNVIQRGKC